MVIDLALIRIKEECRKLKSGEFGYISIPSNREWSVKMLTNMAADQGCKYEGLYLNKCSGFFQLGVTKA